jgi:hypothetical protein
MVSLPLQLGMGGSNAVSLSIFPLLTCRVVDFLSGWLDIATASYVLHRVSIYLNLGGGNFSRPIVVTSNALNARAVRAADIDVRAAPALHTMARIPACTPLFLAWQC